MQVDGYPWGGGVLSANGTLDSSGTGPMVLQHLAATGEFSAQGVAFTGSDMFSALSGRFNFAFDGDSPVLRLTSVEARQNDEAWSGEGASNPDGKLHLDLINGERQLHLVGNLTPADGEARLLPAEASH